MRIQTALRERNTRLLSLCFRSEFHVLVPCFLRGAQGTCCPRPTSTTGRSLQKHSQDPGFQNIVRAAGPLLNSHPASFTRPPRSVLQSITLEPLGQGVGGGGFLAFRSPGTACNAFNLLDFRRLVKGGFSELSPPRPSAAVSGDSPTTYQPLHPPSTLCRTHLHPPRARLVPKGAPSINGSSPGVNPRVRPVCAGRRGSGRVLSTAWRRAGASRRRGE